MNEVSIESYNRDTLTAAKKLPKFNFGKLYFVQILNRPSLSRCLSGTYYCRVKKRLENNSSTTFAELYTENYIGNVKFRKSNKSLGEWKNLAQYSAIDTSIFVNFRNHTY